MYEYLKYYGLDGLVAATKSDKISRNEMAKNTALIRNTLGMRKEDILIPVSSLKKTGYDKLLDEIEGLLSQWTPERESEEDKESHESPENRKNPATELSGRS